jgi:hypothetical protein
MKKGIVGIIILAIGIGLGAGVASQIVQKPEITNGVLSERSKEYLSGEKNGSSLGSVYMGDKKELPTGKEVAIDDCFSVSIPFGLKMERRDEKCNYYFQIEDPRGSVFAYQKNSPSDDWNNVPGITMRRQSTWTYTEKMLTVNKHQFLTFKSKDGGKYQRSAFYRTPKSFIVINLEANTNENLDKEFEAMLKSVKLK